MENYKKEKESRAKEQAIIWLLHKPSCWTRMEMRLIHAKISKNIHGFLHIMESYAPTDIP